MRSRSCIVGYRKDCLFGLCQVIPGQLRHAAAPLDLAFFEHIDPVADDLGEVNVLLGTGIAKIPEVMKELRNVGYKGLVAIEYEHEGSVDEDVRLEVEYARKLL